MVLRSAVHTGSDGSSCMKNEKKSVWERSSNLTNFLTSTHLADHCIKWGCLSDCRFRKVPKIVRCSPPPNLVVRKMCRDGLPVAADKQFVWSTLNMHIRQSYLLQTHRWFCTQSSCQMLCDQTPKMLKLWWSLFPKINLNQLYYYHAIFWRCRNIISTQVIFTTCNLCFIVGTKFI